MKIKDLLINQMNKRAYELKVGWKKAKSKDYNDIFVEMANDNLKFVKSLLNENTQRNQTR